MPDGSMDLPGSQDKTSSFRSLGKQGITSKNFEDNPASALEPIDLTGKTNIHTISFVADEVTALCPVTGQPDFYTIYILFSPEGSAPKSIESKSLKLYLGAFRNKGIFAEALADQVCNDIVALVQPITCRVEAQQKSRGGITLVPSAMYIRGGNASLGS